MQSIISIFTTFSYGQLNPVIENTLMQNFATLQTFYIQLFLLVCGAIILSFLITSIYKAWIWIHITEQKHTGKYLWKFIGASVLWQIVWFIAALCIFLLFTPSWAAFFLIVECILYLYFTPFVRLLYKEKKTIMKIYKEACITAVKKFKHFIIPLAMMCITLIAWLWVILFISAIIPFMIVLLIPLFLLFAVAWMRFYFAVVAKKIGV
jgi:hypothetical protein